MIHSFRLRLALLSSLLAGLALVSFGLGSWWLVRSIKLEHIDNEVSTHAEREVTRNRNAEGWQREESKLLSIMGLRDSVDLLLLVEDQDGELLYRSADWPAGLDAKSFAWPSRNVGPQSRWLDWSPVAVAADLPPPPARPERLLPPEGFAPDGPPPPPMDMHPEQIGRPPIEKPGPHMPPIGLPPLGQPPLSTRIVRHVGNAEWHIGLASTMHARLAVAVNAQVIARDMDGIRNAYLTLLPLALLLIGFGSWIFSSRAMRPLQKLTMATRGITAQGLHQRIPEQGEDQEFVELISVYNRMLERLERSFQQAHRFSADAAHELKTPLAILQGQLERAIHNAEHGSPMQEELAGILDEVRRLSTISRKLLLLSQADAGGMNVYRQPFELSLALEELVEDTRMLATDLKVTGNIQPGIVIAADGALLLQVLHNLISNAIKYNVKSGWIHISTAIRPNQIAVAIANSSVGIQEAERNKVFERFYRADPAHGRQVEGVGLGLSVSREIARAHGGDITLRVDKDGGVTFELAIPVDTPDSQKAS